MVRVVRIRFRNFLRAVEPRRYLGCGDRFLGGVEVQLLGRPIGETSVLFKEEESSQTAFLWGYTALV